MVYPTQLICTWIFIGLCQHKKKDIAGKREFIHNDNFLFFIISMSSLAECNDLLSSSNQIPMRHPWRKLCQQYLQFEIDWRWKIFKNRSKCLNLQQKWILTSIKCNTPDNEVGNSIWICTMEAGHLRLSATSLAENAVSNIMQPGAMTPRTLLTRFNIPTSIGRIEYKKP